MSTNIKGFVWTTKNFTPPAEKNTAAYRGYMFYGGNANARLYVPNINLVNHPLWVYNIRHKHGRWNVKKNKINYGSVPKKDMLRAYYNKRGLNPYNIYVMASNVLNARQKNQTKQNAIRQQNIHKMRPGPARTKKIKNRRNSYTRHQDVINLWKNIKNISKNMIGANNATIRGRIARGLNQTSRPIPSQTKIKALQNLIPSYTARKYNQNRKPTRRPNYYNGFNNNYHTNSTPNNSSVNAVKRQLKTVWNRIPNNEARRPRIPPKQ
jgi:hypothetical protein